MGRTQICCPTSNSFLHKADVSVVTGALGNELGLTLLGFVVVVVVFLDGSEDA